MAARDPRLLTEGELWQALKDLPTGSQKIVGHLLAQDDAADARVKTLEEVVYVLRRAYGLLKWLLPFVLPAGGFILRGLV